MRFFVFSRKETEQARQEAILSIYTRLEELESAPSPEDHQPYIDRLDAILENHTGRLASQRETLDGLHNNFLGLLTRMVDAEGILEGLRREIKDQTHAISEGIERTARAERRVAATVSRARKELEGRGFTDPGLDAEDKELRVVDGAGGAPVGLQAMPEAVEASSVSTTLDKLRNRGLSR